MNKKLTKLLVVVAKEPVPGKVKTRLFPQLSPTVATDLYRCFLSDRIQEVSTLNGVYRAIAYTPENARETFMTLALDGFELFAFARFRIPLIFPSSKDSPTPFFPITVFF